jgi:hypothetical protein
VLAQAVHEFAIGEVLDAAVDRQREVAARLRLAQQFDVLNLMAEAVAQHALEAGLSGQPVVEGKLGAFLALVVDVRVAEHVGHDLAARVVALEFALAEDAGNAELDHRLRVVGIDLALDAEEFLAGVGALAEAIAQRILVEAGGAGEFADAFVGHFLRVGADRRHRRRHRKRLAVAVEDRAARHRDFDVAQVTRVALLLVEVLAHDLQIDRAHDERAARESEHARDRVQARARMRGFDAHVHRRITTVPAADGAIMPSFSRAIWSMRLLSAQVACSSCRRPNSKLRSSRSAPRCESSTNCSRLCWRA